ncbi:hypothetical protein BC834DRAFT_842727 [Gloeopeniophorella convolvens]|nr:hypothetical protein BC834DRAFT_842727 [Gloeopeniophorella convolvens]
MSKILSNSRVVDSDKEDAYYRDTLDDHHGRADAKKSNCYDLESPWYGAWGFELIYPWLKALQAGCQGHSVKVTLCPQRTIRINNEQVLEAFRYFQDLQNKLGSSGTVQSAQDGTAPGARRRLRTRPPPAAVRPESDSESAHSSGDSHNWGVEQRIPDFCIDFSRTRDFKLLNDPEYGEKIALIIEIKKKEDGWEPIQQPGNEGAYQKRSGGPSIAADAERDLLEQAICYFIFTPLNVFATAW